MTNEWIPNPSTGVNPVREGETLVAVRFQGGSENYDGIHWSKWSWSEEGEYTITHYQVSPPRKAEPATTSADEVLIRAREALIAISSPTSEDIKLFRHGGVDEYDTIQAIIAYERDRAKPLAEVAPHTAEDPDLKEARELTRLVAGASAGAFEKLALAAIKRGRELERNVSNKETV